jgi:hypothetical protein
LPVREFAGRYENGFLSFAAVPFNAFVELVAVVTVMFAALMANMLASLITLAGFTLRTFPALTFLVFPVLPVLVPVFVVDLYDATGRGYSDRRDLKSRCWHSR